MWDILKILVSFTYLAGGSVFNVVLGYMSRRLSGAFHIQHILLSFLLHLILQLCAQINISPNVKITMIGLITNLLLLS
jgi:hypothetical protein